MPRVIDLPADGPPLLAEGAPLAPPPPGTLRWIDIERPTAEVLGTLREPFGLHPLAIEDCLTFEQRPKLEEYPRHLFVVIHYLAIEDRDVVGREMHAFLSQNALITVHAEPCGMVDRTIQRLAGDAAVRARGIGFVYYLVADGIASENSLLLDEVISSIDEIEDGVLHQTDVGPLPRLFELKRSLASARRLLSPQRDVFAMLSKFESDVVSARAALYFRDVYDKVVRACETIDANRELLGNVLDAHFSVVSQRTNEIMKRLTVLSAIFLPLTFITGFFGQNFDDLPFHSPYMMWLAIGSCLLVPPAMLLWFRLKRWL